MSLIYILILSFIISFLGVKYLIKLFSSKSFLDIPDHRSSHTNPTPTSAGLAVVIASIIGFLLIYNSQDFSSWKYPVTHCELISTLITFIILAAISFYDDRHDTSALLRIFIHIAAVIIGVYHLPDNFLLFDGKFPFITDRIILTIGWVWFINLYNFMDGIDGITATETITITLGMVIIGALGFLPIEITQYASIILVTFIAFLIFNWHPAKIFLGDVGAVSFGYLLAWLLIRGSVEFSVLTLAILPMYHFIDATFTITKRAFRKEKIWQPHKTHFFQIALRKGLNHSQVVKRIAINNVFLLCLAIFAALYDCATSMIIIAFVETIIFIGFLINPKK